VPLGYRDVAVEGGLAEGSAVEEHEVDADALASGWAAAAAGAGGNAADAA
jgi:hypothetical protein